MGLHSLCMPHPATSIFIEKGQTNQELEHLKVFLPYKFFVWELEVLCETRVSKPISKAFEGKAGERGPEGIEEALLRRECRGLVVDGEGVGG